MNYAVVILAFVLLVAIVYWFIAGRFYYTGPRTHTKIVNGMVVSDDSAETLGDQEKGSGDPTPNPLARSVSLRTLSLRSRRV
jgi:uncharacterized membrane protein YqiK